MKKSTKQAKDLVNQKSKKQITLFDIYRKQASKGFNYPTVKMCSDGDVCTYLKSINL